jgi:hypothetical protein
MMIIYLHNYRRDINLYKQNKICILLQILFCLSISFYKFISYSAGISISGMKTLNEKPPISGGPGIGTIIGSSIGS